MYSLIGCFLLFISNIVYSLFKKIPSFIQLSISFNKGCSSSDSISVWFILVSPALFKTRCRKLSSALPGFTNSISLFLCAGWLTNA